MKIYKFKRVLKNGRIATTRIRAESILDAWSIFEHKFDKMDLTNDPQPINYR